MTTPQAFLDLVLRIETAEAASCEAKLEARKAQAKGEPIKIARVGRTILFSRRRSRRESAYNRAIAFSTLAGGDAGACC